MTTVNKRKQSVLEADSSTSSSAQKIKVRTDLKLKKPKAAHGSGSESEESIDSDIELDEDQLKEQKLEAKKARLSTQVGGGRKFLYGSSAAPGLPPSDDEEEEEEDAAEDEDFMDDEFADEDLEGAPEYEGEGGSQGEEEKDEDSGAEDGNEDEVQQQGKSGFADAMSKILSKTVARGDAPILAKDKTIERKLEEEKIEIKARKTLVREKRAKATKERAPIDAYNIAHEKGLKKIATRGVVKLFNAIRKQHSGGESISSVSTEAKKAKKDKVSQLSKTGFLDMLKSSTSTKKPASGATWNALKDDYMMGANLKDWEKEEEEEDQYEKEMESEFE